MDEDREAIDIEPDSVQPLPEVAVPVTLIRQDPDNQNPPPLPIPIPNCVIQIQILNMRKVDNGTNFSIPVRLVQRVGNDGIGRVRLSVVEKSYVISGLVGLAPPFFGYPILRENWDLATFTREVTNPDGSTETQYLNAVDTKVNFQCPRVDVVQFKFPIEAVLDKYIKIKVMAWCCDHEFSAPSIRESFEGIFVHSGDE